jgi:hypothetical protein
MSVDERGASMTSSVLSPGSVGSAGSGRRQRSYVGETGGGIDWQPKKYRAPKKIKPPKPFSADVKTQNLWVQNVTAPAVDRVRKFSKARLVTLDDVELLELHQPVPKLDSPRSIKACLEMGVDPTGYDLCVVDVEDYRDDRIDESIWMLRYEHAQRKRENLLRGLQEMRHSFSEREALNEFRPAKGKMAHVESTTVAANESMSVQISVHRNERFHEKTRHWERTHQKNLAMEHERQKDNEYKTGESEAYILAKLQEKKDREAKVDRDNYAKSRAEVRRLEFEEAERKRVAKQERLRIDAFAAEKRRLDRIAEREMRESVEEKLRQKEAYRAQTQGILDWQQAKIDAKRRSLEAEDARRAELKRIRDEHDAVLAQAAKDDFQAKIDQARAHADDRLYGRIRDILDREDRRNERQKELDEGERAIEAEAERRRLAEREAYRQFAYNEARRKRREKEDRIKRKMEEEDETVAEHMATLNFHKEMTKAERQIVAEDRRYKAEQRAKRDAHYRFKLQQKIDRENAKAEHVAFLRRRMREDAVRTNVLEAERRRLEREAARKELHETYADAAQPKSFTRGTRVYGKIGLGETGEAPNSRSGSGGVASPRSNGDRSSAGRAVSMSPMSPEKSSNFERSGRSETVSPSVAAESEICSPPGEPGPGLAESASAPRRNASFGRPGAARGDPIAEPNYVDVPGPESITTKPKGMPIEFIDANEPNPRNLEPESLGDPESPSVPVARSTVDAFDDENEDPESER